MSSSITDLYFLSDSTTKELHRLSIEKLRLLFGSLQVELERRGGVEARVPPAELETLIQNHVELNRGIHLVFEKKVTSLYKIQFFLGREVEKLDDFESNTFGDPDLQECELEHHLITLDGREQVILVPSEPLDTSLFDEIPKLARNKDSFLYVKLSEFRERLEAHRKHCSEIVQKYEVSESDLLKYLETQIGNRL